jgi:hypothetical protein
MLTLDQRLRPHPDVVDTELDDAEAVLLHLGTKTYYGLNLTGVRIWRGLKQGLSLGQISRRLQDEFDVEPERADASVLELARHLSAQELIEGGP